MALSGSVFIDRVNRSNALKAFSEAIERVKKIRQSVFIFPEGTRSYYLEPGLLSFKKGAFHFAVQAGIPLIPFVASNYSNIFSFKTRTFESGVIEIELLEPIDTSKLTADDINDLVENTRNDMLTVAKKLGHGPSATKSTTKAAASSQEKIKKQQ